MTPLLLLILETLLATALVVVAVVTKNPVTLFSAAVMCGALMSMWTHYFVGRRGAKKDKEKLLQIIELGTQQAQIMWQLRDALEKGEDAWALDCARRLVGVRDELRKV